MNSAHIVCTLTMLIYLLCILHLLINKGYILACQNPSLASTLTTYINNHKATITTTQLKYILAAFIIMLTHASLNPIPSNTINHLNSHSHDIIYLSHKTTTITISLTNTLNTTHLQHFPNQLIPPINIITTLPTPHTSSHTNPTKNMTPFKIGHKVHPNLNLYPNSPHTTHTTPNNPLKYKPYQKHKKTMAYRPQHKLNPKYHAPNKWPPHIRTKHILQDTLYTHLPNRHNTYQSKVKPHLKYQLYPNNKMASAYQPRQTNNNTYHLINSWRPNSITSQILGNHEKSHFSPTQVEHVIPALPNLFTTTKLIIVLCIKTNMKKPKTIYFTSYYFINKLELLKCGDIELNPGPMPNILHTHPAPHKKRANIYLIPNTIKLQPEYQHIATTFAPILKKHPSTTPPSNH